MIKIYILDVTSVSFNCLFKLKNIPKTTKFNSMQDLALRWTRSHWGRPPRGAIISAKYIMLVKNAWWRHQMETFSALLALCAGNSPVTGEFLSQRPVTRSFHAFYDLRPKKRLRKKWRGWWFEMPSRSSWRHCNVYHAAVKSLLANGATAFTWMQRYRCLVTSWDWYRCNSLDPRVILATDPSKHLSHWASFAWYLSCR